MDDGFGASRRHDHSAGEANRMKAGVTTVLTAAEMRAATIVVDALLGTGAQGSARGEILAAIHEVNSAFPEANVVAVDIPSGLGSDLPEIDGEYVRADYTLTFTAPKVSQVLAPTCD